MRGNRLTVDMLDEGQDYRLEGRPCACYCSIAEDHIWFPAMLVSSQPPRNPVVEGTCTQMAYIQTHKHTLNILNLLKKEKLGLDDIENSQFILITKDAKIRDSLLRKHSMKKKLRVWLNSLLLGLKTMTHRFPLPTLSSS